MTTSKKLTPGETNSGDSNEAARGALVNAYEIIADNIRALQLTYVAAMFEELRVPRVVDKLVELFQNGLLPIGRGNAANFLYHYWRDGANRLNEAERRSFYARALGIPGGDDGGRPNREFNDLCLRFVSAVSSFVRQAAVDDPPRSQAPISQQQVHKAKRDLAANLSLHGYGMVYYMAMAWLAKRARELSSSNCEDILDLEQIRNAGPRLDGTSATVDPTDYDLVNACEQWLAVTGMEDMQVETYAQPR